MDKYCVFYIDKFGRPYFWMNPEEQTTWMDSKINAFELAKNKLNDPNIDYVFVCKLEKAFITSSSTLFIDS